MFTRAFLFVTALLLAFAVSGARPAPADAPDSTPRRCIFETYSPQVVEPYYVDVSVGLGPDQLLRGAALFIQAREGLTREWLELSIWSAYASPDEMRAGCLPNVRNLEISVGSAGPGFWVYLLSAHSAEDVRRWSQAKFPR